MEQFDVDWYTVKVYDAKSGTTTTVDKLALSESDAMEAVHDDGIWEPIQAWISVD